MPDEEHKLTIQIETNAARAADDMERLDAAQRNASRSGSKLGETERRGSAAEARRVRLRAKYMRSYLRDIRETRKNTEQATKGLAKLKTSERDVGRGALKTGASATLMLKRLLAVGAALAAVKHGFNLMLDGLEKGKDRDIIRQMTGVGSTRQQMWERAVRPFGGSLKTTATSMGSLERNIALANMGEQPFSDNAYRLLGDAIQTRPGMTSEEFLRNIAPRMQKLTRAEALLAGQSLGLTPDMALFLRAMGAEFEKALEKERKAAAVTDDQAKKANELEKKANEVVEGAKNTVMNHAISAASAIVPNDPKKAQQLGAVGVYAAEGAAGIAVAWLLAKLMPPLIKAGTYKATLAILSMLKTLWPFLTNPATWVLGVGAAGVGMDLLLQDKIFREQLKNKDPQVKKQLEEERNRRVFNDLYHGKYNSWDMTGAFNTDTPLNHMPPSTAFAMGMRAGAGAAGDKVLNLGGITINTASDDPREIAERVAGAGRIVLDEFARLDRLQAGEYYA